MATMVGVVLQLPTGEPTGQAGQLGWKVGGHLALCCIHRANRARALVMGLSCYGTLEIVLAIAITVLLQISVQIGMVYMLQALSETRHYT